MLNRWLGIALGAAMLVANFAVFQSDVLSTWFEGSPPPSDARTLGPGEERRSQLGIYLAGGRRVGQGWTRATREAASEYVTIRSTTVLEPLGIPGAGRTPPVQIELIVTYRVGDKLVDQVDFKMLGLPVVIRLHGEAMPSGEFPCEYQIGVQRGSLALDSGVPSALGDAIRPFDRLPDLQVGQRWRMKLLDPVSQLMPHMGDAGFELEPVEIAVVRKEVLPHHGGDVETFVVEGGGATAWVAPGGEVLRQVVKLPLIGELTLLDEPYDEEARQAAIRRMGALEGARAPARVQESPHS